MIFNTFKSYILMILKMTKNKTIVRPRLPNLRAACGSRGCFK